MRMPQIPPDMTGFFSAASAEQIKEYFGLVSTRKAVRLVRRANDTYLHWDKLRHRQDHFPEGMDANMAWMAVTQSRLSQFQSIPVSFESPSRSLKYWTPPQHQQWLHEIDQGAGGFIGSSSGQIVPNERHLLNSLMEEAIASSQLEGASTTRERAKKMLRAKLKPKDENEQMIVNNYRAIMRIRSSLKNRRLTPKLLLQLQELLTNDTLQNASAVGRFRTSEESVVVEDKTTQEVIYEPPPASVIEERIKEICTFANTESSPFVHPVTKAIILHFAIGFVHPFVDGNGRTARALFYWYMLKHGYWLFEYLPLSRVFLNAPAKYTRAYLYTETDEGDVTYFIHYHLRVIVRAIEELHQYIEQQQGKLREAASFMREHPLLNHRQTTLLSHALKHPSNLYTISQHQGYHHVTYATARKDILALVEMGMLDKLPHGGRQLYFSQSGQMLKRLEHTGQDDTFATEER